MDLLKKLDDMITAKLILTGKETYDKDYSTVSKHDALEAMIEFAKLHVEAALKEASEKAKIQVFCGEGGLTVKSYTTIPSDKDEYEIVVNEHSILNSYSLKNIK
jgi:hypothetical protein